eukprot:90587_1
MIRCVMRHNDTMITTMYKVKWRSIVKKSFCYFNLSLYFYYFVIMEQKLLKDQSSTQQRYGGATVVTRAPVRVREATCNPCQCLLNLFKSKWFIFVIIAEITMVILWWYFDIISDTLCIEVTVPIFVVFVLSFFIRSRIQAPGCYDRKATVSMTDLLGKTALITGGNSGIGLGAAIHLSKLNAKVIIACRNQQRADNAVQYIKKQSGNNNVSSMILDLGNISSIQRFAQEVNDSKEMDIDYLLLNAGIANAGKITCTKDGYNPLFQVNYYGHWLLTNLILDKLKATADKRENRSVRIVSTASSAHKFKTEIPYLNDDKWNQFITAQNGCQYSDSKLLNIIHMRKLQQILNNDGYKNKIVCCSIAPGLVRTGIVKPLIAKRGCKIYPVLCCIAPMFYYFSRNYLVGAEVILHACTNKNIIDGAFYRNCQWVQTKDQKNISTDSKAWDIIWKRTEELFVASI